MDIQRADFDGNKLRPREDFYGLRSGFSCIRRVTSNHRDCTIVSN